MHKTCTVGSKLKLQGGSNCFKEAGGEASFGEKERKSLSGGRLRGAFRRCCAYVLAAAVFVQPLPVLAGPALAGGTASHPITVDSSAAAHHKATIKTTTAGVPQVDIVAPNAAGISHNKFTDFNVAPIGTVLNNGTDVGVAVVGGAVDRNRNLSAGGEASAILLEVTSSNRSHLDGYTEVVGQPADVIVANPNGITCKGCGFIGTPNVELTTRSPDGVVRGGDIVVDANRDDEGLPLGAGLDARLTEQLKLNAAKVAVDAPVLAGKVLAIEATGAGLADGEQFAIDASALGAMLAGTISLIATNEGFGVRSLSNVVSHSDDIEIRGGKVVLSQTVAAARDVVIEASQELEKTGAVVAGRDVVMNGQTLESEGGYYAGRNLALSAEGDLTLKRRQSVPLPPDIPSLSAQSGQTASAEDGSSSQDLAEAQPSVITDEEGSASADGNLDNAILAERVALKAGGTLVNELDIIAGTDLVLEGEESIFNSQNVLFAGQTLVATSMGLIDNDGSSWHGEEAVEITTPDFWQSQSLLSTGIEGVLDLQGISTSFGNTDGSVVVAEQGLSLNLDGDFDNQGGAVLSQQDIAVAAHHIRLDEGTLAAFENLTLTSDSGVSALFASVEAEGAVDIQADADIFSLGSYISALDALTVEAGGRVDLLESVVESGSVTVTDAGSEQLTGQLTLRADDEINLSGSRIFALGTALMDGRRLTADSASFAGSLILQMNSRDGALLLSNSTVEVANWLANSAEDALLYGTGIATTGDLGIAADDVLISDSTLLAGGSGLFYARGQGSVLGSIVQAGDSLALQAENDMRLHASLVEAGRDVLVSAGRDARFDATSLVQAAQLEGRSEGQLDNAGTLLADEHVLLTADRFLNSGDLIASTASLAARDASNSGSILADAIQAVVDGAFTNSGLFYGSDTVEIATTGDAINQAEGLIHSDGELALGVGGILTNAGALYAGDTLTIGVGSNFYTQTGSSSASGNSLSLHTSGALIHSGTLRSAGDAWIRTDGQTWGSGLIDVAVNLTYSTPGRFDWYENRAGEEGVRIVNASSRADRQTLFKVGGDWRVEAGSFGLYADYAFGGDVFLTGERFYIHKNPHLTVAGDFDAHLTGGATTTEGLLETQGDLRFEVAGDVAHGAELVAGTDLAITGSTGTVEINGGLEAASSIWVQTDGALINAAGSRLLSGADMLLDVGGSLWHQAGARVDAGGNLAVQTGTQLINDGAIVSAGNAWITAGTNTWGSGVFDSAGDLTLRTNGAFNIQTREDGGFRFINGAAGENEQSLLKVGGALTVVADNFRVNAPYHFTNDLTLVGKTFGADGVLNVDGDFRARFRDAFFVNEAMTIAGSFILNDGTDDEASQLVFTNTAPITTGGEFVFDGLTFDNRASINAQDMTVRAGENSWHNSGHLQVNGDYTIITSGLAENTGFLDVTGDIYIEADQIVNRAIYQRPDVVSNAVIADSFPSLPEHGTVSMALLLNSDGERIWAGIGDTYFRYSDIEPVLQAAGVNLAGDRLQHVGRGVLATYVDFDIAAVGTSLETLTQYSRVYSHLSLDEDLLAQAWTGVEHFYGLSDFMTFLCEACSKTHLDLVAKDGSEIKRLVAEQARRDSGQLDVRLEDTGVIRGQNITLISGSTIENLEGGHILANQDLTLQARDNIITQGAKRFTGNEAWDASFVFDSASLAAQNGSLTLTSLTKHLFASGSDITAGENLIITVEDSLKSTALIDSYASKMVSATRVPEEAANGDIDRHVQLEHQNVVDPVRFTAGNSLVVNANTGTLTFSGTHLAGRDIVLNAGRDIYNWGQAYGAQNPLAPTLWQESTITASRDVLATAGRNFYNAASSIAAGGTADLHASNNLKHQSVLKAHTSSYYDCGHCQGHFFDHTHQQAVIAAGEDVRLSAGSNFYQLGSAITAGNDIAVLTGSDILLKSLTDRQINERYHHNRGWFSRSTSYWEWTTSKTLLPEQTAGRDITLAANQDISAIGAQLRAGRNLILNAGGNISFSPEQVDHYEWTKVESSGFSVFGIFGALIDVAGGEKEIGGAIVDSVPLLSAIERVSEMESATDLAPLVNLGVELANNWSALQAMGNGQFQSAESLGAIEGQLGITGLGNGIPIPASFGFYSNTVYTRQDWTETYESTLHAGGDIIADAGDSILLTGTKLLSERDTRLSAVNDIVLETVAESYSNVYEEETSGVDFSFGLGQGGNPSSVTVAFSKNWQNTNGSGVSYTPSSITAGGDVSIDAGSDIDVIGSTITGDAVSLVAGDTIDVITVQDIYNSKTRGGGYSFGASFGAHGFTPTGSLSYLSGKKDYRWSNAAAQIIGRSAVVIDSPALNLVGSLIANIDETGKDQGNLEVNAPTITYRDLYDYDKSKFLSFGVSLGVATQKQESLDPRTRGFSTQII